MPIYEYVCDNCGHDLEAIQKVSEAPLLRCPSCDQDSLRKKISAAGFRLKGGGWYETDFKSGKKKNVSGADTSGGSESKTSETSTTSDSSSSSDKSDSKNAKSSSGSDSASSTS
jgi:putative FmdB family regulatory protein